MGGREVWLVATVGLLFLLLSSTNNRASGSRSTHLSLVPLPQDDGKKEGYRGIDGGSYAGTLWLDPWHNAASAVAAPFSFPEFFLFNNEVTQSYMPISLISSWSLYSSSVPSVAVVVDKEQKRPGYLKDAVWVRAHQRWRSQRGNGDFRWLAAGHPAPSSFLLAEGRLILFLPSDVREGRQFSFWSEFMAFLPGVAAGDEAVKVLVSQVVSSPALARLNPCINCLGLDCVFVSLIRVLFA